MVFTYNSFYFIKYVGGSVRLSFDVTIVETHS